MKNLRELADALENMPDDIFRFHVNEMKNDFAAWIRDVIKEDKLALEIAHAYDQKSIQVIILKYIVKCV